MNFFKKIKLDYYSKTIPDLFNQKKFSEIKEVFEKIYKLDRRSALLLFRKYYLDLSHTPKKNFFDNNIVWINSFLKSDCQIIIDFFDFYFKKTKFQSIGFLDYSNELLTINKSLQLNEGNFENIVNDSYFYQYCIGQNHPLNSINFIKNQIPFFETSNKKMFSIPNITKCFFYIVRDPIEVLTLLNQNNNQDNAIMELLNLDQKPLVLNQETQFIQIARKDWQTNVNSWTNENVIESFNGLVLTTSDLQKDPYTIFAEVIAHLIQAGVDLNLDYNLIQEYIEHKHFKPEPIEKQNLSNHKKKLLKGIAKTAQDWGYDINL